MELKNSTILITGRTSGIGLEFVKQLTEQGANIIVTGRNTNALNKTKKQFQKVYTLQSDVSKPKDIEHLYKDVTQQFPQLNIIINNTGIMRLIELQDMSKNLENILETYLQNDWVIQPNPNMMMKVDKMVSVAVKGNFEKQIGNQADFSQSGKWRAELRPIS